MFQFNQFHVINSLTDELSGKAKFEALSTGDGVNARRIARFYKANISAAYYKAANAGRISTAAFDLPTEEGLYRIKLYVKLSGSQNSYYANDFVFKGKPFYIEFAVAKEDVAGESGSTTSEVVAKTVAASMVNNAKAVLHYDGLNWLKVEADDEDNPTKVTFTCPDEYQLFTVAELQKLSYPTAPTGTGTIPYNQAVYTKVDDAEIVTNKLPFGTWFQITKDIELPTLEHRAFAAHNEEQMPIPGKKYDQFTIYYKKDRGSFGGAAVGQQVTSEVAHIFYVENSLTSQFKTAFSKAVATNGWTNAPTEKD